MKIIKRPASIVFLMMFFLASVAVVFGGGEAEKKEIEEVTTSAKVSTIGVIGNTFDYDYTRYLADGIKEICAKYNIEVIVLDAEKIEKKIIDHTQNLISRKVDAIIELLAEPDTMARQGQLCQEAGIPFLAEDSGYSYPGLLVTVSSNNIKIGEQISEWMAKQIEYKGNIIVLTHPTATATNDRRIGLETVLKKYPEIKIIEEHVPDVISLQANTMRMMQDFLVKYPSGKIDAVWAFCDQCGIGAASAIDAAGRSDEIVVIGIDGINQGFDLIRSGKSAFRASIAQRPKEHGRFLAEMAIRAAMGERVIPSIVFFPTELYTIENIPPKGDPGAPAE